MDWDPADIAVSLHFSIKNVPNPSRRAAGEELWVEATISRKGPPLRRPIRLGVKKGQVLTPLGLD